jgi:pilus assembly protein CpaC
MIFHHRWTPLFAVMALTVASGAETPAQTDAAGATAVAAASPQTPSPQAAGVQAPGVQQPPAASPQAAEGSQEVPNELTVTVGKSLIVATAQPIERISVGYNDVAEATAVSPREVLVNGKTTGETSLIVWEQGGNKLFFDLIVRPNTFLNEVRLDAVRRELKK